MKRAEDGSITPLIVGLAVIVALLVAVVVDASAAYLRREGLNSLADAAALAATEGIQGEGAYTDGLGEDLAVDPDTARQFVADYLEQVRAARRYDALDWTVRVRGRRVLVELRAFADLPLHVPGTPRRTAITGSAAAVVTVGE